MSFIYASMILGWNQAFSVDQRTIIHSPVEWILLRGLEFLRDEGDQQTCLVELRFHSERQIRTNQKRV